MSTALEGGNNRAASGGYLVHPDGRVVASDSGGEVGPEQAPRAVGHRVSQGALPPISAGQACRRGMLASTAWHRSSLRPPRGPGLVPRRGRGQRAGFWAGAFVEKVVPDAGLIWNGRHRDFGIDGQIEVVDAQGEVTRSTVPCQSRLPSPENPDAPSRQRARTRANGVSRRLVVQITAPDRYATPRLHDSCPERGHLVRTQRVMCRPRGRSLRAAMLPT
jgi:hypothetical protein